MIQKSRPMSDAVRYFIRNLGNHNELKINATESGNMFSIGFYREVEFAYFRVHFDELYDLVHEAQIDHGVRETLFGPTKLDELCFQFVNSIYIGTAVTDEPHQIEEQIGSDTVPHVWWMHFDPQESLYEVAEAFFQLFVAYTEAWEFDNEEAYERFYHSAD